MINITESMQYLDLANNFYKNINRYLGSTDTNELDELEKDGATVKFTEADQLRWQVDFNDDYIHFIGYAYNNDMNDKDEAFFTSYNEFIDYFEDLYDIYGLDRSEDNSDEELIDELTHQIYNTLDDLFTDYYDKLSETDIQRAIDIAVQKLFNF